MAKKQNKAAKPAKKVAKKATAKSKKVVKLVAKKNGNGHPKPTAKP